MALFKYKAQQKFSVKMGGIWESLAQQIFHIYSITWDLMFS